LIHLMVLGELFNKELNIIKLLLLLMFRRRAPVHSEPHVYVCPPVSILNITERQTDWTSCHWLLPHLGSFWQFKRANLWCGNRVSAFQCGVSNLLYGDIF
jgi:hypothetical protein